MRLKAIVNVLRAFPARSALPSYARQRDIPTDCSRVLSASDAPEEARCWCGPAGMTKRNAAGTS